MFALFFLKNKTKQKHIYVCLADVTVLGVEVWKLLPGGFQSSPHSLSTCTLLPFIYVLKNTHNKTYASNKQTKSYLN